MVKENCIFCKIVEKNIPSRIVYEDPHVLAFEDLNPKAPVHILIVPKKHIERVSDIDNSDSDITGHIIRAANKIAHDKGISESGYRIVINCNKDAGQEVFHLHFHLLGGRKFAWPPG